jgi:hypothetical protein
MALQVLGAGPTHTLGADGYSSGMLMWRRPFRQPITLEMMASAQHKRSANVRMLGCGTSSASPAMGGGASSDKQGCASTKAVSLAASLAAVVDLHRAQKLAAQIMPAQAAVNAEEQAEEWGHQRRVTYEHIEPESAADVCKVGVNGSGLRVIILGAAVGAFGNF